MSHRGLQKNDAQHKLWRLASLSLIGHGLFTMVTARPLGGRASSPGGRLLCRLLALAEVGAGLALLRRAPISVPALYHSFAGIYDAASPLWHKWSYADAYAALDRQLAAHLPSDGDVLDLGCGTGANLDEIRRLGLPFGSYTGVDLSPDMLERAREKHGHLPGVTFVQTDIVRDSLPAGSYDVIVSAWVFEHLDDPVSLVEKAWRSLRPGGHMVLLFEVDLPSEHSGTVDAIWRLFSARLITRQEYERFPGLETVDVFEGVFAPVAVITLGKPTSEEGT